MNSNPATQTCSLQSTRQFDKNVEKLPKAIKALVSKKLLDLAAGNLRSKPKALVGNYKGLYSLRVGDYRVLLEINQASREILLVDVGHRKEIYD
jgi:mRNA interferase RelE/StbE